MYNIAGPQSIGVFKILGTESEKNEAIAQLLFEFRIGLYITDINRATYTKQFTHNEEVADIIDPSTLSNETNEYSYNLNLQYSLTAGNAGNILVLIDNSVKGKVGDFGEVVDSFVIDSNFR